MQGARLAGWQDVSSVYKCECVCARACVCVCVRVQRRKRKEWQSGIARSHGALACFSSLLSRGSVVLFFVFFFLPGEMNANTLSCLHLRQTGKGGGRRVKAAKIGIDGKEKVFSALNKLSEGNLSLQNKINNNNEKTQYRQKDIVLVKQKRIPSLCQLSAARLMFAEGGS